MRTVSCALAVSGVRKANQVHITPRVLGSPRPHANQVSLGNAPRIARPEGLNFGKLSKAHTGAERRTPAPPTGSPRRLHPGAPADKGGGDSSLAQSGRGHCGGWGGRGHRQRRGGRRHQGGLVTGEWGSGAPRGGGAPGVPAGSRCPDGRARCNAALGPPAQKKIRDPRASSAPARPPSPPTPGAPFRGVSSATSASI